MSRGSGRDDAETDHEQPGGNRRPTRRAKTRAHAVRRRVPAGREADRRRAGAGGAAPQAAELLSPRREPRATRDRGRPGSCDTRQPVAMAGKQPAAADTVSASGLEGLEVARTALSDVDGERGRLVIAGHDVEALAGRVGFEDVCLLLWEGRLPESAARERLCAARWARRGFEPSRSCLGWAARSRRPTRWTRSRAALAHLSAPADESQGRVLVTAATAVFVAAWCRIRAGKPPLAPDPAERARRRLPADGHREPATHAAALDSYLVTVADHGMNASTFAARVVASTGSDLVSAVVAAIGALKGPLHGGAPGPGARHARRDRGARAAAPWLEAELAAGRRIMGMGHRIYRVRDPRAAVLEKAVEALERAGRRARGCGWRAPSRRAAEERAARSGTRSGRCARTSSSTRRCCSTRSACRARRSRPRSRSGASPAGAPTSPSSGASAA